MIETLTWAFIGLSVIFNGVAIYYNHQTSKALAEIDRIRSARRSA